MVTQQVITPKWCPFIADGIKIIEHCTYPPNDFLVQAGQVFRIIQNSPVKIGCGRDSQTAVLNI